MSLAPESIDLANAEGYWIGRPDPDSEWYPDVPVILDNEQVSRKHAMLWKVGDDLFLTDTGLNGTYIEGERLEPGDSQKPQNGPFFPVQWHSQVSLGLSAHISLAQFRPREEGPSEVFETSPTIEPGKETITIGRSSSCDIVCNHPRISRKQAHLTKQAEGYILVHTGTNPTRVNGQNVAKSTPVSGNILIESGPYRIFLDLDTGKAKAQTINGRMSLHVMEATRRVKDKGREKVILDQVSLTIRPNEIVGIMGPSGSGKTTLMNVMNGYHCPESGTVCLSISEDDGTESVYDMFDSKNLFRQEIGYVPQDDIIHRELTVGESLKYTADLRLRGRKAASQHSKETDDIDFQVTKVLTELDLERRSILSADEHGNPLKFGPIERKKIEGVSTELEDTRRYTTIGTPEKRGISGGERKRVNIAQELLSEPEVLFLDEPTSGLSSVDAENLMEVLKRKATLGSMIILTIHQPSEQAFLKMNNVIIMDSGGKLVYYGPTSQAASYFEHVTGLPRSPKDNPADYVLRALEKGPEQGLWEANVPSDVQPEAMKEERFKSLYQNLSYPSSSEGSFYHNFVAARKPKESKVTTDVTKTKRARPTSAFLQWWTLTKRYTTIKRKDLLNTLLLLGQAPIIGLFLLLAFAGNTDYLLHNGALYDLGSGSEPFDHYLRENCGQTRDQSFAGSGQITAHQLYETNCHRLAEMKSREYDQSNDEVVAERLPPLIVSLGSSPEAQLVVKQTGVSKQKTVETLNDLFIDDAPMGQRYDARAVRKNEEDGKQGAHQLHLKSPRFKEARADYWKEASERAEKATVRYQLTNRVLLSLSKKVDPLDLRKLNGPNPQPSGKNLKYAYKNEIGFVKLLLQYFFTVEEFKAIYKSYKEKKDHANWMQVIPESHRQLIQEVMKHSKISYGDVIKKDQANREFIASCDNVTESTPGCSAKVSEEKTSYEVASTLDAQRWLIALFLLAASGFWFGITNSIREIVTEQAIFLRERMVNLKVAPYLCSKLGVLSVLSLGQCLVLLLIVWPFLGLSGQFSYFLGILFMSSLSGIILGFFISALVKSTEAAMSVLPIILIPQIMLAGALKHIGAMHPILEWLSRLMPVRWILEGMVAIESQSNHYLDNVAGIEIRKNFSEVLFRDGGRYNPVEVFYSLLPEVEFMVRSEQMSYVILKNIGIVSGFCLVFALLSLLLLRLKSRL